MVKELLLGDNPFIGVSHLAHEKSRESLGELTLERKAEILETAIEAGATGFTFSTHQMNLELLKFMKDNHPDLLKKLNYYILFPYATGYVREATKTGTPGLLKKILFATLNKDDIRSLIPLTPSSFIKAFVEMELREYLRLLPEGNIKAVLLHEVLTEIIVAFELVNVLETLKTHFDRRRLGFGLETRNLPHLKGFLETNNLRVDYIMTPMNPLGYQMTDVQQVEKDVIQLSQDNIRIIAINVLASGAVDIQNVLKYLRKHRDFIYAIAIGTSKPSRAKEIMRLLRSTLMDAVEQNT